MSALTKTILLLICSNTFMTFAWYAHLKNAQHKMLWIAIITSWMIAFFEYMFQVPANRLGFMNASLSLAQLKILQEVITLSVFVPFDDFLYATTNPVEFSLGWSLPSGSSIFYFSVVKLVKFDKD